MKKILALFIAAVVLLSVVEIIRKPTARQIYEDFDGIVHVISLTQITWDNKLIGKREFVGKDTYIGTYFSSCISENGRDVIFGGASVKDRKVCVHVNLRTESGNAILRIRLNSETEEYEIDNKNTFEKQFYFCNGSNYIMLDYNNFTGTAEIYSDYV